MGRFVSPVSLRAGKLNDWKLISNNQEGFWKSQVFLKYIEGLLTKYLLLEDSIIFGDIKFLYKQNKVCISISIYDRSVELAVKNNILNNENLQEIFENNILKKLFLLKSLIKTEGIKYYNVDVETEFKVLSLRSLPSEMLAKYISLLLEQGNSLQEVLKLIIKEFTNTPINSKTKKNLDSKQNADLVDLSDRLPHRLISLYSEENKKFKPYKIGNKTLLGFRIDCAGRFSRKQRAGKKSIREGTVSLGGYKGFLDYGASRAILEYGVCGIKVWLYFEEKINTLRNDDNYIAKY